MSSLYHEGSVWITRSFPGYKKEKSITYSVSETVSMFQNTATSKVTGGTVAEWSARQTHDPAVPGSSQSRSGELLDLLLVVPSSNPWPH